MTIIKRLVAQWRHIKNMLNDETKNNIALKKWLDGENGYKRNYINAPRFYK